MKRLVIALAFGCALVAPMVVAGPAAAQMGKLDKLKNTTPEQRATVQTAVMKKKLGLTGEQAQKIAAINLKYAQKMEPVIKGSAGPLIKMREAESINQEKEGELKSALNPEQFEKYLAGKEEMREKIEQKLAEKAGERGK